MRMSLIMRLCLGSLVNAPYGALSLESLVLNPPLSRFVSCLIFLTTHALIPHDSRLTVHV